MAGNETSQTTQIFVYIAVALIAFVGGLLVTQWPVSSGDTGASSAETAQDGMADSDKIPVGNSPTWGPSDAPVTIVEFSDFQCPFCEKGYKTLEKVKKNFPDQVRIAFKQLPLPFHKQAKPAARAALAAHEQGKFWEMHDKLFENQDKFKQNKGSMKEFATGLAKEIGLDVEKFKKDYDKDEYADIIKEEKQLAQKLKARGTPHFFVNGERVKGAQPYSRFKKVINNQLDAAKKLKKNGVAADKVYAKLVKQNYEEPESKKKDKAKKKKDKGRKVAHVPISDSDPVKGNTEDPLVTIVEFSEFECPFCKKAKPSVDKLMKNYGDKIRLVWKDYPLPFHNQAKPAARAAIAAQKQGKFWEMHDLLFKNQKKLKQDGLFEKLAKQAGLNVDKFKKDFNSSEAKQRVKDDMKLGKKVGVRGTPNIFINGVQVTGAQPYSVFKSLVEKQIDKAESIKKSENLSGDKLYEAVVKQNKKDADKGGSDDGKTAKNKKQKDNKPDSIDTSKLSIGDAPVKGPEDAPVTIYEFSDFECPFCKKGGSTLDRVLNQFDDDQIRVVYKHYPLPFHKNAKGAAKASMAAQKQGKFWEMNEKLFGNQKKLGQDGLYVDLAKEIGLNVEKFKKDMESSEFSNRIQEDMKMGKSVGVRGTPAFFINDKKLVGAQPASKFKSIIKSELDG